MEALLKIIHLHGNRKSAVISNLLKLRPESNLTNSHINNWLYRDNKTPSEWVLPLCETVDWQVTPHELRPDLYPHPEDGLPAHLRQVA